MVIPVACDLITLNLSGRRNESMIGTLSSSQRLEGRLTIPIFCRGRLSFLLDGVTLLYRSDPGAHRRHQALLWY